MLVTLLFAAAFGYLLVRLKVPGGMMIGAVIGACLYNLLTGQARLDPAAKTAAQIIAGAFIGSGVRREDLRQMKPLLKAAGIVIGCLFLINLSAGLLVQALSPLDPLTALLATTPGGVSDIPIIAADLGADAPKVLVLQLVRMIMGIGVFPSLIARFSRLDQKDPRPSSRAPGRRPIDWPNTLLTLLVAAAFGLLGRASPLPGGTMALATLGSILFKLLWPRACLPDPLRKAAQCLSGTYVGAGIGIAQLIELKVLALPALVLVACYGLGALLISSLLVRSGAFSRREALLAATPAGASDMALISADLGIQNVKLVLLQVMRLITVITVFPTLLNLISHWLAP
ncbi:MAG: AbrB family transcriptional regulator [Christensenellales bacterium]